MHTVIIKPLITEISMKDAQRGKYTFQVALSTNKTKIKHEIEKIFNVNVIGVSTSTTTSSKVRNTKFGRYVSKNKIKKARVVLKKGQTIAAFEAQDEEKKKKKEKKEQKNV